MNKLMSLMNYAITVLSLGIVVMAPPAVISGVLPSTKTFSVLSVILYVQLWALAIELAYRSAANIYSYERKELLPGYCYYNFISKTNSKFRPTSGLALATR